LVKAAAVYATGLPVLELGKEGLMAVIRCQTGLFWNE
jgi:hypothetical protein